MIERIWTAYKFELAKAYRSAATYIGPVLVLLTVALMPLRNHLAHDGTSGYAFLAEATQMAVGVVGLFLLLIYSSCLVSSELGRGTIRMVLVRPILRHEFLLAKLMLGMSYAVVINAAAAGASWGIASVFSDLTGISFGGEVIHTSAAMAKTYLAAMGLGLLAQFAAVSYALTISTCTRSTAAAVGASVGLWLIADLLKHSLGIGPFLFSTYIEAPWAIFMDRSVALDAAWLPMAYHAVGTSAGALLLFTCAAIWSLARRNLHS